MGTFLGSERIIYTNGECKTCSCVYLVGYYGLFVRQRNLTSAEVDVSLLLYFESLEDRSYSVIFWPFFC